MKIVLPRFIAMAKTMEIILKRSELSKEIPNSRQ